MCDKILCLILTTQSFQDRIDNIKNTWANDIDHLFYSDHHAHNIIKVTDQTDYKSAEIKTVNMINLLFKYLTDKYDWFYFCDDDTFLNTFLLKNIINNLNHNTILCHKIDRDDKIWPQGGAGYFIHKTIIQKARGKLKVLNTGYSDMTVGICLSNLGFEFEHTELLKIYPPKNYGIQDVENYLSFHYINTYEMMNELYEKCKSV